MAPGLDEFWTVTADTLRNEGARRAGVPLFISSPATASTRYSAPAPARRRAHSTGSDTAAETVEDRASQLPFPYERDRASGRPRTPARGAAPAEWHQSRRSVRAPSDSTARDPRAHGPHSRRCRLRRASPAAPPPPI